MLLSLLFLEWLGNSFGVGWELEKLKLVTNKREESKSKEKDAETHWANERIEDDPSYTSTLLKCNTTIHAVFFSS